MRLLFISDLQLGGGEAYGVPGRPRLADHADTLQAVTHLVADEEVDLVVICGDVFHHRRPGPDELLVFARWLDELPVEALVCAGNHDIRGPSLASILELFDTRGGGSVFLKPGIRRSESVALAFLPWSHPGPLRARYAGSTPVDQAEALLRVAAEMRDSTDGAPARVLVTHHALSGMSLPNGLSTGELIGEPVLDTTALFLQGWDAIVAGHVHKHDVIFRRAIDDHPGCAVSVGSPWVQDFGEADEPHGVLLLDVPEMVFAFRELPGRRFVTIDLDASEGLPAVTHAGIADAVVRIRIRCTEQAARDVDLEVLRRFAEEAGAHKVHAITLDVARPVRARAQTMAEDAGPLAAVDSWLEATRAAPRESARLRDITARLLEEV